MAGCQWGILLSQSASDVFLLNNLPGIYGNIPEIESSECTRGGGGVKKKTLAVLTYLFKKFSTFNNIKYNYPKLQCIETLDSLNDAKHDAVTSGAGFGTKLILCFLRKKKCSLPLERKDYKLAKVSKEEEGRKYLRFSIPLGNQPQNRHRVCYFNKDWGLSSFYNIFFIQWACAIARPLIINLSISATVRCKLQFIKVCKWHAYHSDTKHENSNIYIFLLSELCRWNFLCTQNLSKRYNLPFKPLF